MDTDLEASIKEPQVPEEQQVEEAIQPEEEQGTWSKNKKRLVYAGISVLGIFLALLLATVLGQNFLIYPATKVEKGKLKKPSLYGWNAEESQSESGFGNWERVEIKTKDNETLVCHWLEYLYPGASSFAVKKENLFTVIHFHGNGGDIGDRAQQHKEMMKWMQYRVLLVDYRGYGESSGSPSEAGLKIDAQAALDWTLKRLDERDHKKLVVYGQSMGGAVAIHLAADNADKFKYLVVENTFLTLPKVAGDKSFLLSLLSPLINQVWNNEEQISKVKQHILFLSSEYDEVIPNSHIRELFNLATNAASKELVIISEGGHNDAFYDFGYCQSMNKFVRGNMFEEDIKESKILMKFIEKTIEQYKEKQNQQKK